jgi:hypothetical protein
MAQQKTKDEIERALQNVDTSRTKYPAMTYEQGVEETLQWCLGEIPDEEFEFSHR